jgi:hypothetical protein
MEMQLSEELTEILRERERERWRKQEQDKYIAMKRGKDG